MMRIVVKSTPRVIAPTLGGMLVVNRFRMTDHQEAAGFEAELGEAARALGERPGFVRAESGRNVDEPELWVLVTTWADVGSYRRALSSYDVKVALAAIQHRMLDEPSAYQGGEGAQNTNAPRQLG